MSCERFNKTGLRDAYNVLKHLEDIKDKQNKEEGETSKKKDEQTNNNSSNH